MEKRREELSKLKDYTKGIDNELTMILQSLQWDREHLLKNPVMTTCRYDSNHKIPPEKSDEHERECFLRQNGYTKDNCLLPDPLESESSTLVKLSKGDIAQIIENASRTDPLFKRVYRTYKTDQLCTFDIGVGCRNAEPMSLERLQSSYTSDERRAIHDAVVSAAPSCHDLADLALLSGGDDQSSKVILSRVEILAELRNMRRRRTKYRVAAKTRNYSDVLRDVIKTQMEHYHGVQSDVTTPNEPETEKKAEDNSKESYERHSRPLYTNGDRYRYEGRRRDSPRRDIKIEIKTEREDSSQRNRDSSRERRDRAYRYEDRTREAHERERDRRRYAEKPRERSIDEVRSRRHHENTERDYNYDERTKEKRSRKSMGSRYDDDSDRDVNPEKKSKRCRYYENMDVVHQVKKEPRNDEDRINYKERSRQGRHDENTEHYKHKEIQHRESNYDYNVQRDRRRSKERRQEDRYKERSSERVYIKQEREDSTAREHSSQYEKYKSHYRTHKSSYEGRYERSHGELSYDGHTTKKSTKEHTSRYYDTRTQEVYDPNKKIKVEK